MSRRTTWLTTPLRALPRTVTPMLDETLDSFVWRLARRNGLDVFGLRDFITAGSHHQAPIVTERLSLLTGRSARALHLAMPELAGPEERASLPLTGRPRPGGHRRHACPKCARMFVSDPTGWVRVWARHEDVVCQRHWYWTDSISAVSLAGHPDVVRANRRHRRLIRRWGREAIHETYERATAICDDWYRISRDLKERVSRTDWNPATAFGASIYPHAVALTRLMTATYWRALIIDEQHPAGPQHRDLSRFVLAGRYRLSLSTPSIIRYTAEVRRTAYPSFFWAPRPGRHTRQDLFTEWVIDQVRERVDGPWHRPREAAPCTPDTLPEPAKQSPQRRFNETLAGNCSD